MNSPGPAAAAAALDAATTGIVCSRIVCLVTASPGIAYPGIALVIASLGTVFAGTTAHPGDLTGIGNA